MSTEPNNHLSHRQLLEIAAIAAALERCLVNCPVGKDAYEAPAKVTPQDGVPGTS